MLPLVSIEPWVVPDLLICVQILVRLDCFSHSITMEVWNVLGEKQPKFTETNTLQASDEPLILSPMLSFLY